MALRRTTSSAQTSRGSKSNSSDNRGKSSRTPKNSSAASTSWPGSDSSWSGTTINSSPNDPSSHPPTATRPTRETGSSATRVNLKRYQSDSSWSSVSSLGSSSLPMHEDRQIADIKLRCLQAMKEKRKQVKV